MRGFHVGACPKVVAAAAINTRNVSCVSRLAVIAAPGLRRRGSPCLDRVVTRHAGIRSGVISESARFTTCNPSQSRVPSRRSQGISATGAVLVLGGVSVSGQLWALALVSVSVLLLLLPSLLLSPSVKPLAWVTALRQLN